MKELQIEDEFKVCQKQGIRTYHHPVVDESITENREEFIRLVKEVVDDSLRKGKSVVVHCKGGLGRAPTFACACLIYSGRTFEEALKMVRTARKSSLTSY